jgi:hypothetical protein
MHQDYDDDAIERSEEWGTIIKSLMKLDIIEQLVGEDGKFYYRLTELGVDFMKGAKDGK